MIDIFLFFIAGILLIAFGIFIMTTKIRRHTGHNAPNYDDLETLDGLLGWVCISLGLGSIFMAVITIISIFKS